MIYPHKIVLALSIVIFSSVANAADDPLKTLRPGHPRLLVLDDQIHDVQRMIQSDPLAASTLKRLKTQADKMIERPVPQHVLIGPRMLAQSREALTVITTTAGLYRITGDVRYADRARKEMLAVAAFADWNPSHFLDVAEMTNACGLGYDWIYNRLNDDDRKTIRLAIVNLGLKPGLAGYQKKLFWTYTSMNWAQVCAGGLTVGALAVADEEPDLARQILLLTRATIAHPMAQFAPDGGWDEGPGYWNYGTHYNVNYLAAIETALGTDWGLENTPGFADTGLYHIYLTGPAGKNFNFADAAQGLEPAPQMFWLAKRFNRPVDAAWERTINANRLSIFHLLWFDPDGQWVPDVSTLPLDATFKRVNVAFIRSSWTDKDAWYVGFKGGDNGANHSHLDLGTFVLDALGQRWAMDLGADDYDLPGYFGKQRFTYYRLSTRAHNTITFAGENQPVKAKAPITAFRSQPDEAFAQADLSAGYPAVKSVHRGISLLERKRVIVQDEIEMDHPIDFDWNFHTPATVTVDPDGRTATMSQAGVKLRATLLSPSDAKFDVTDSNVPAPQKQNPGISHMVIHCNAGTGTTRVTVLFGRIDDTSVPAVEPLSEWGHHP